jgi:hypothetical protein
MLTSETLLAVTAARYLCKRNANTPFQTCCLCDSRGGPELKAERTSPRRYEPIDQWPTASGSVMPNLSAIRDEP